MTTVSAIVVNYRAYAELDACLASLRHQPDPLEILVVDQESDAAEFGRLARRHPGVCWLAQPGNSGFAAGVNLAARQARGAYLYLVNPDSVVDAGTPRALSEWLAAHDQVGVAGSLVRDTDGGIQGSARRFPDLSTFIAGRSAWLTRRFPANALSQRNVLTGVSVSDPTLVDWVSGASMMIRREAFEEARGFDARYFLYWEDADLCRRLKSLGWATAYVPGVGVTHHGARSSRGSARSIVAFHKSAFRYFLTHTGVIGRIASPLAALALAIRLGVKLLLRGPGRRQVAP